MSTKRLGPEVPGPKLQTFKASDFSHPKSLHNVFAKFSLLPQPEILPSSIAEDNYSLSGSAVAYSLLCLFCDFTIIIVPVFAVMASL